MRIACIGGGPAGLYFAILLKKAHPGVEVDVYERNRPDDTFGWGVVFSDETLDGFERADAETFAAIRGRFANWTDIETYLDRGGEGVECVRSTGHGFCGLSRKELLQILHARARELGARLVFERELKDDAEVGRADLVLACDGINSFVRTKYAEHFRPALEWRRCKFAWFGTTRPLEAFTFVFKEDEHGLWRVHAYNFDETHSTFIVETTNETFRRAGLEQADEDATVAFCERLFAEHLDGNRLLKNKAVWRNFPIVRCGKWWHRNAVLLGDACHTAHFSIGSGTKLALEDAIALAGALGEHARVDDALDAYERRRRPVVDSFQAAALRSRTPRTSPICPPIPNRCSRTSGNSAATRSIVAQQSAKSARAYRNGTFAQTAPSVDRSESGRSPSPSGRSRTTRATA